MSSRTTSCGFRWHALLYQVRLMERQLRCLAFGICRPASPVSARIGLGRSSPFGQVDSMHPASRPAGALRASKSASLPICHRVDPLRASVRRDSKTANREDWHFAFTNTATNILRSISTVREFCVNCYDRLPPVQSYRNSCTGSTANAKCRFQAV